MRWTAGRRATGIKRKKPGGRGESQPADGQKDGERKGIGLVQSQAVGPLCCAFFFGGVESFVCPASHREVLFALGWRSHTGQDWTEKQLQGGKKSEI